MYVIVGILGLLIGLLFLFVRQKIYSFENRLNLLSDTIQAIAGLNVQNTHEDEEDEDEEDEDEDEEDEDEKEFFNPLNTFKTIRLEPIGPLELPKFEFNFEPDLSLESNLEPIEMSNPIEILESTIESSPIEMSNPIEILESTIESSPIEMSNLLDSKVITLERVVSDDIYEKMSVKELKEKVAEVDGPKFKTKKEMVDFLKSR